MASYLGRKGSKTYFLISKEKMRSKVHKLNIHNYLGLSNYNLKTTAICQKQHVIYVTELLHEKIENIFQILSH